MLQLSYRIQKKALTAPVSMPRLRSLPERFPKTGSVPARLHLRHGKTPVFRSFVLARSFCLRVCCLSPSAPLQSGLSRGRSSEACELFPIHYATTQKAVLSRNSHQNKGLFLLRKTSVAGMQQKSIFFENTEKTRFPNPLFSAIIYHVIIYISMAIAPWRESDGIISFPRRGCFGRKD